MLTAAAHGLHHEGRVVFAVAPTATAARTVERDTRIPADTVAKLLHEHQRTDRPPLPEFQLPAGATLVVDEAGMLSTPALHQPVSLADRHRWRVALVGDPRQLQGVGRGGLLAELCVNGRVEHLERLHRFTHAWEAAASLQLRRGDPRGLDPYEAHGRIVAGTLDEHLDRLAATWLDHHHTGRSVAVVASTNDHVDTINHAIQAARVTARHLDSMVATQLGGGEIAYVGDVIATRRNDRRLIMSSREPVRTRDIWTVTAIDHDGSITVTHRGGHGDVTIPADYVREHVRPGYAATEHGWQSDTVDTAKALTSTATTRRGLYVAATRGRDDVAEARDVLEAILASDRADVPATTQRRALAQTAPQHTPAAPTATPRCEVPDWFVFASTQRAAVRGRIAIIVGFAVAIALITGLAAGLTGAVPWSHVWTLLPCFALVTAAVALPGVAIQHLVGGKIGTLLMGMLFIVIGGAAAGGIGVALLPIYWQRIGALCRRDTPSTSSAVCATSTATTS